MSKVPDKIFCDDKDGNEWGIWFNEPAFSTDAAYIRKDALLHRLQEARAIPHDGALIRDRAFQEVINYIKEM